MNLEEVAGADEEIRDEMCMDSLFSDNEDDFSMSATPIQQLLNEMKERTDMDLAEFHEFINVEECAESGIYTHVVTSALDISVLNS